MNPITPIINGLKITLKHMFMKPVTLQYPTERPKVAVRYRGLHGLKVSHSQREMRSLLPLPDGLPGQMHHGRSG